MAVSIFRQKYQQKMDEEVASIRAEHPEFVIGQIAKHLIATVWEVRSSLKRLRIVMPEGRRPRPVSEN